MVGRPKSSWLNQLPQRPIAWARMIPGAIASATVGIGVRGGAEACLAASDVFLARGGIGTLVELETGARRTVALIRLAIGFSLVYNVAGAALAFTGTMDPLIAAIVMPASSLSVVIAAWRGRTFPESFA